MKTTNILDSVTWYWSYIRQENIPLDAVAVLGEYEFFARSMTPMAVQVCGTILNKCVYTGDNRWAWG